MVGASLPGASPARGPVASPVDTAEYAVYWNALLNTMQVIALAYIAEKARYEAKERIRERRERAGRD